MKDEEHLTNQEPNEIHLSGHFNGSVAINGDAIDLRNSENVIYKPDSRVSVTLGNHINIEGNNNVVGDRNSVSMETYPIQPVIPNSLDSNLLSKLLSFLTKILHRKSP